MRTLATILFFCASFIVRSSRWIGLVQQKEYRFDRLFLFLYSIEGRIELLRVIPKRQDFTRAGFKRPAITFRSVLVTILYFMIASYLLVLGFQFVHFYSDFLDIHIILEFLLLVVFLLIFLCIIPFLVLLAALPTAVLAYLQTYFVLYKAKTVLAKSNPKIIGVTGSYGKTSTKLLLAHVLQSKYSVFYTPKSFNTRYSIAASVVNGYKGQNIAIIEYGAYKKGEIAAVTKWIQPEIAVVTGLTTQHLGLFGSIENIISAKSELVAALPQTGEVICNAYDPKTLEICEQGAQKNEVHITAIREKSGPAQIKNVSLGTNGKLQFIWKGTKISTELYGLQYQELIRTVITVAAKLGISDSQVISALQSFVPNEKFIFSYRLSSSDVLILDDGDTANPKGFTAVISIAEKISASKKVLITGGIVDLGNRSREIHLELARSCSEVFDQILYVTNTGLEEFSLILEEKVVSDPNAIEDVLSQLSKDDLLVIEGRMPPWIQQRIKA